MQQIYQKANLHFFEWINLVENHHEYLTINSPKEAKMIALAITKGLNNVKETIRPIDILQEELSRTAFIQNQKK